MVVAYLAAFACALCYGLGSVLQSVGAKRVQAGDRLDPRLLARVATQVPYVVGLGLDSVGWLLSLVALVRLPVFVVQAVVAASIGFVVLFAALVEHVRPTPRQVGFLVALGVGLLGLALTAAPDQAHHASSAFTVGLWIAIVVIGVLGALVPRLLGAGAAASVLGALAGLAFGGTALCARSLAADPLTLAVVREPLAWALAAFGLLGLTFYAAALQRGSVTVTTAWLYTASTIAPAVVGLTVLGDRARAGLAAPAAASFAVTVAAAVGLSLSSPPSA
jgi:drug/metabolite transporter (DMT)-like permease